MIVYDEYIIYTYRKNPTINIDDINDHQGERGSPGPPGQHSQGGARAVAWLLQPQENPRNTTGKCWLCMGFSERERDIYIYIYLFIYLCI